MCHSYTSHDWIYSWSNPVTRISIVLFFLLSSSFAFGQATTSGLPACGAATTGNIASWGTGGCVSDAGVTSKGRSGVIGTLRGANMNVTTDQAIPIASGITAFQITKMTVTNCTGTLTLAVGGLYPTTSKGGTPIVAASQAYSSLSAGTIVLNPTIASNPRVTLTNVYFSLTTAAGSAATCDIYVLGDDLT
jgi:hypothetical protein